MQQVALSSNAAARAIDVTPSRVNDIVCERRGISADTAQRFARLFNASERFWMNVKVNYDLHSADDAGGEKIARIRPIIDAAAQRSARA